MRVYVARGRPVVGRSGQVVVELAPGRSRMGSCPGPGWVDDFACVGDVPARLRRRRSAVDATGSAAWSVAVPCVAVGFVPGTAGIGQA